MISRSWRTPPTFAASPNQFDPKSGLPGASVTLLGHDFNVGTVAVRFGTTPATIVGTPTASQIRRHGAVRGPRGGQDHGADWWRVGDEH